MMPNLIEQPGLFFVVATLLPLLSFVVLLLWGAIRWGLRPYAKNSSAVDGVYQAMGGAVPGRGPAYVALAAIVLAFVCCLTGFILFRADAWAMHDLEHKLTHAHGADAHDDGHSAQDDHGDHKEAKKADLKKDEGAKKKAKGQPGASKKKNAKEAIVQKKPDEKAIKAAKAKEKEDRQALANLEHRWQGQFEWARVSPAHVEDGERGTVLSIGFRIDMLSAVMFVMVTFIASLIHLFSIGYMAEELHKTVEDHEVHTAHGHYERRGRFGRFFMFLSLFCFSMLNLILADNLFQIFVSWELVGLCSFLLVGFYYERTSASNAANKAFITNRVGDAGFIIGLLIIWTYFGTLNFEEVFSHLRCPTVDAHGPIKIDGKPLANQIIRGNVGPMTVSADGERTRVFQIDRAGDFAMIFPRETGHLHGPTKKTQVSDQPDAHDYSYIPYWMLVAAGLGIFLGCVGKSAQFPLHVWLPDAMEGPTPVSALIHAATMVAAGVYLVGRCYPMFTPEVLLTISYVGAITLFVAASVAVVMTDIKKVLAYSTVSQLGYMMLGIGVGGWTAGLLHLLTHAFFKALLFLGSGSVIYGCHHQQDMLKMGGLYPKMKITAITMLMGVLAICGIPLFSGWYSKDEILVGAYGFFMANKQHVLLFLLPLATAGITAFYMFRMWFLTFTGKPRDEHVYEHAHESPWPMTVPLILLAILSVCVAWPFPGITGGYIEPTGSLTEADKSWVGHQLEHYSQPDSVDVDFRKAISIGHANHILVGALALGVVGLGILFASVLYFYSVLDPADAKEQFPGVHRFLAHKWYFDELYSAALVRPALIIAGWCRNFDLKVIDGFLHLVARVSVGASRLSGRTDRNVVDGFVNVMADVFFDVGTWLRNVQTGFLRSYVLFLALAAVAIWVLLYAWATALGG